MMPPEVVSNRTKSVILKLFLHRSIRINTKRATSRAPAQIQESDPPQTSRMPPGALRAGSRNCLQEHQNQYETNNFQSTRPDPGIRLPPRPLESHPELSEPEPHPRASESIRNGPLPEHPPRSRNLTPPDVPKATRSSQSRSRLQEHQNQYETDHFQSTRPDPGI